MGVGIAIIALEDKWKPSVQSFEDSLKEGLKQTGESVGSGGRN